MHTWATAFLFLPFPLACLLESQGLLTLLCPLNFLTAPRYDWKCFTQHADDNRAVISVVVLVMMEEDTRPYPDAAGTGHSSRHCCQSPASCLVQLHVPLAAETQSTGSAMVTSALQPPHPDPSTFRCSRQITSSHHITSHHITSHHIITCNSHPPQLPPQERDCQLLAGSGFVSFFVSEQCCHIWFFSAQNGFTLHSRKIKEL